MIANNWSNKHKNNYNQRQYWLKSGTGVSSGLRTKGLEPTRGQEPTTEALKIEKVQEVHIRS